MKRHFFALVVLVFGAALQADGFRAEINKTAVVEVNPYYSFKSIERYDGDGTMTLVIETPKVMGKYLAPNLASGGQFCRGISSESLPPFYKATIESSGRQTNVKYRVIMGYDKGSKLWKNVLEGSEYVSARYLAFINCHYRN